MRRDHWYTMVTDERLQQGNILNDCNIIVPKPAAPPVPPQESDSGRRHRQPNGAQDAYGFSRMKADVVVLTQTCDLANEKIGPVIVCPSVSLDELYHKSSHDPTLARLSREDILARLRNVAENIRIGRTVGRYMLGPCTLKRWERGVRIVDFEKMTSVPYGYLQGVARLQRRRLRMKSPYREDLAQSFAIYFMRVALGVPITKDLVNDEIEEVRKRLEAT